MVLKTVYWTLNNFTSQKRFLFVTNRGLLNALCSVIDIIILNYQKNAQNIWTYDLVHKEHFGYKVVHQAYL